ncbi:MAG TPA: tRNA uridine-5-carboxymethylaminomethyl(34) synthesis GTPase MnmE [Chthonomonadales bacterium]|nr:tRNA uridine-5-carboxymethylaminomethyl(34) synthesis GTPase MnmE [Chthonomonadales bacterium]
MLHLHDTIAAIATPPGEGGIGIVRISGPVAFSIADRLFATRAGAPSSLPSHTIHYGLIRDPETGEHIDDALLLPFRKPRSYTGEDVVEFSCHGGPVTLGRVLTLALRAGARLAEPGEFTQRAFLNGRMDLAQAEAVCDQIRARTEAAQRLAMRQREGALSREVARIREDLVGALAAVEVTIDFSEEVGDLDYAAMAERLAKIRAGVDRLIATAERGRIYREGVRLCIVGRPNVGKSSLLNALLRENRAIVTPIAGTTRDVIEETAHVRGIPLIAIDTAGLRETQDLVERIGVERARAAIETASFLLFVLDASTGWTEEDASIAAQITGRRVAWVLNKVDLISLPEIQQIEAITAPYRKGSPLVPISAMEGTGLEQLEETIACLLLGGEGIDVEEVIVSNVRHLHALEEARNSLLEAERTTAETLPPDFISIDLRAALDSLGRITGETATEEIIHRIFHDFCIGK